MTSEKLAILIPVYGQLDELARLIDSLMDTPSEYPYDVFLVDDGTSGGLDRLKEKLKGHTIITRPQNGGFTIAVNDGLAMLMPRYDMVVLLNSDMEVEPGWLEGLVERARLPHVGLVGGMELSTHDGDLIICGGNRPAIENGGLIDMELLDRKGRLSAGDWNQPEQLEWVSFGCVLITRDCYNVLGPLDIQFRNYFSDTDYGIKANLAGFDVWYEPRTRVKHHAHASTRFSEDPYQLLEIQRDKERFCRKWENRRHYDRSGLWAYWLNEERGWRLRFIPHFDFGTNLPPDVDKALKEPETIEALACLKAEKNNTKKLKAWEALYKKGMAYGEFKDGLIRKDRQGPPFLAGYDVYVLSPHPDDAALSLGALLLDRVTDNSKTLIHCLFGRSDFSVPPLRGLSEKTITAVRALEELYWCTQISALSHISPLPDRLVRKPGQSIFLSDLKELEWDMVDEVLQEVLKCMRKFVEPPVILAPLSAGLMADHIAVAAATAGLIRSGYPVERILVYDDLPYSTSLTNLQKGIDAYGQFGLQLDPIILECSRHSRQTLELLAIYYSQMAHTEYHRIDQHQRLLAMAFLPNPEPWNRATRLWKVKCPDR